MKIKVIITGATGMVGEGVLIEALNSPEVEQVLIINRKPSGFSHPKLKEIIHSNFFDISPIASQLSGYNACFFCLGVSALGLKEADFPLAKVLEGGTWWAGRAAARELRADGSPPLKLQSDGTVF